MQRAFFVIFRKMHFLEFEYRDFSAAAAAAGFDIRDFHSVKKQGKLHFYYGSNPHPFKFFRKTVAQLDDRKAWVDVNVYTVYGSNGALETIEWEQVLGAFRDWLKTLPAE